MHDSVKVGVFGVGSLGQWHARIYNAVPEAVLVGVYDADLARAREVAERYGTRAFETPTALARQIEAASVVVPTDRHAETALPLIERGLHLLVEKPIAATLDEAEALTTAAARRSLVLQVGHVERFNPAFACLEAALASPPRLIECARLAPFPPPRPALPPRGTEVSVVLDLMIHDLDLVLHLAQSPLTGLEADGLSLLSSSEDAAHARLRFANGCTALLAASRISPDKARTMRVYDADGYWLLDFQDPRVSRVTAADGRLAVEARPVEKGDALERELRDFLACIRERRVPRVDGRRATEALRTALAICRRIRTGAS